MTTTSASSSVTSSIVQTLGGGSGIDMAGLAEGLATAQFAARLDRNSSQTDTLTRQISAASNLKNYITQLASSVSERIRGGDGASQPAIANPAVATVSRGTLAGSGSYSLEVTTLASAQGLASQAFAASTTTLGAGTLTLRFGTVTQSGFTEDTGHTALNLTIAPGATLADVAGAINRSGAGITAYVANAADGAHLVLKGQEGASNGFVIEASEDPANPGLSALAWSPAAGSGQIISYSGDAAFSLDGLAMTSRSNRISDVAPGLSLQLTGTNKGAPTTIGFSDPSASITTFMQDFTAALNEVVTELNKDADPKGGDLARDPGARALRSALVRLASSKIMPNAATGEPSTLAELGLATNRDGSFRLDTARLAAMLKNNASGAAAMFTTGLHGIYATIQKLGLSATISTDPGSLGGSVARYTALQTKLTNEKSQLTDDQEKLRQQLVSRFAKVDTHVGASRATLSFIQNQIAAWNAQKN